MENKFVIFCTARTGSYLLVDYLNQQKGIVCHGELYKPAKIELDDKYRSQLKINDKLKRDSMPLKFLNEIYRITPSDYTGFKIFPAHNKKVRDYLSSDISIKKVLLRRNEVEVYLSLLMARKTKMWINKDVDKQPNPKLIFHPSVFDNHYNHLRCFYDDLISELEKSQQQFFTISYNELVGQKKLYDLIEFIKNENIPGELKLETKLKKQITKNYKEIVSNYSEMIQHLSSQYPEVLETSKLEY